MKQRKPTLKEKITHHLGNIFSPALRRENRMMVKRTIRETWERIKSGKKPLTAEDVRQIFHEIQTELGVLPKMSPSEVWDAVEKLEKSWYHDSDGCWTMNRDFRSYRLE